MKPLINTLFLGCWLLLKSGEILSGEYDHSPVTIKISHQFNFGYLAFGQSISELFQEAFPDEKVRIVILTHNESEHDFFNFGERAELHSYDIPIDVDENGYLIPSINKASQWLNQASEVVMIDDNFNRFDPPMVNKTYAVNQIDNGRALFTISNSNVLLPLIQEYQGLASQARLCGEKLKDFYRNYWRKRESWVTEFPAADINLPADKIIEQWHKEVFRRWGGRPAPTGAAHKPDKEIQIGFGEGDSGFIMSPGLYRKAKQIDGASFEKYFDQLMSYFPKLETVIQIAGKYRYFMTYMHDKLKLAEFIAMAAELDGSRDTVILTNLDDTFMKAPVALTLLNQAPIRQIEYLDFKTARISLKKLQHSAGKKVWVVRLPEIKNTDEYNALFYYSNQVVGVTGNHSLFNAITMGKLPFYSPHLDFQVNVNSDLANYDDSGLLAPFFTNKFLPIEKARIIQRFSAESEHWQKRLLEEKVANKIIMDDIYARAFYNNPDVKYHPERVLPGSYQFRLLNMTMSKLF